MSKAEGKIERQKRTARRRTANLRAWMKLSGGQKVDFFEEMVELAYRSGALRPERLALRDKQRYEKSL